MKNQFLNRQFRITSPKSTNRLITLSDPMQDSEIHAWDVQEVKGDVYMTLRGENAIYCRLKLGNNVFEGRDVRGGFTILRPEDQGAIEVRRIYSQPLRLTPRQPDSRDSRRVIDFTPHQEEVDNQIDQFERKSDAAIAIVGCNRPQYLKQVIEGLQKSDMSNYDVFLFLDRPKLETEWPLTDQQVKIAPTDRIIRFPINFGCGRVLIDVRRQLFDRMGYERAFIFEDDLVPGPNYLKFCESLLAWGQSKYTNIGAVQGWTKCLLPPDQKKKLVRQVHVTYTNWWGYLTTKGAWDQVKQVIYTYRDSFLKGDYALRPVVPILQYFKPMVDRNFHLLAGGLQPDAGSLAHRRRLFDSIPSGQDGATWMAYDAANLVRLAPSVNRALYIGEVGIHSTSKAFQRDKFDKMTLDIVPQDARMKNFEIRS